ncbi:glycosyltransferase family 2 protein [Acinetobacter shaoyimingii]|uniref:Glycosyltransferase family 2 protein n=1 Tax=Acinetobacter shaoyimingii TaxID=2715164 RepID=A0A6G8RRL7_9GAMM|nr:glycosyltransferase family 2 protein [Acinetobacter shaoyimingii]QIO04551.1 glycosyltransferase family 2 protein [Acinetobacter shaoyimingii]
MMSKYVSIGIPFYNAEKFFSDAIQSVLYQTYQNWELILIDDGSTDKSLEIANRFAEKDSRIRVISDGQNRKLPARLNQLIELSQYDYIARMDADDLMHPERLEQQIRYMSEHDIDVLGTSYYTIDKNNQVVDKRIFDIQSFTKKDFFNGNYYICHPSILAKKAWYLKNKYNENADRAEDYELWLRSVLNNDFNTHILPTPLMFYREDGSISKTKLVNSYKTTLAIFHLHKKKFTASEYFYVYLRNMTKIFLVSHLYSDAFEKYLLKRRSTTNSLDQSDKEDLNQKISKWLSH